MTEFITSYGYAAIFVAVFVDTLGAPVLGELVLLAAGVLVSTGRVELAPAIVLATLAAVLADTATFWVGRWARRATPHGVAGTTRRWLVCTLGSARSSERILRLVRLFGDWLVFAGKFIPGVRVLIPPIAGASSLGYGRFLVVDTAASTLWSAAGITAGALMGRPLEETAHSLHGASPVAGIVVIALLGGYVTWKVAQCRARATGPAVEPPLLRGGWAWPTPAVPWGDHPLSVSRSIPTSLGLMGAGHCAAAPNPPAAAPSSRSEQRFSLARSDVVAPLIASVPP